MESTIHITYRAFFAPLLPIRKKKQKKDHSRILEEKLTKMSNYIFLFGSFFDKGEKSLLIFCLDFQIYSIFNKKTLNYSDFYLKSVR